MKCKIIIIIIIIIIICDTQKKDYLYLHYHINGIITVHFRAAKSASVCLTTKATDFLCTTSKIGWGGEEAADSGIKDSHKVGMRRLHITMQPTTWVHTYRSLNQINVYLTYKTKILIETIRNAQYTMYASLQSINDHHQYVNPRYFQMNEYLTALLDK